jgi:hypothetical protein
MQVLSIKRGLRTQLVTFSIINCIDGDAGDEPLLYLKTSKGDGLAPPAFEALDTFVLLDLYLIDIMNHVRRRVRLPGPVTLYKGDRIENLKVIRAVQDV